MAAGLLGPPELRRPTPPSQPKNQNPPPPPQTESNPEPEPKSEPHATLAATDPFVDLMVSEFNKAIVTDNLPMGLTENHSATFLTSGNPCLDFFFHVVPSTPPAVITALLDTAWAHDPLITLKLICNLRGVRGTGKSDKEGFYTAAFWLHSKHPKTLESNVPSLADFGYFKDLPEILYRLVEGNDVRNNQRKEWKQKKRAGKRKSKYHDEDEDEDETTTTIYGEIKKKQKRQKKQPPLLSKEERLAKMIEKQRIEKEQASASRKEKKISMAKKVVEKYSSDSNFQFLYGRISDYFAECLKKDMQHYGYKEFNKVSLAAKWCPSIDSSFDRSTLLCESIAKKMFPKEAFPEYREIEEAHYAYRVRDRLRKEVLVPLRKTLELPEVYIGANRWDLIPYNRVASVAMKFYKEKFIKHDKERFDKYLEDVKAGKTTIAAGALLPHEIIESLIVDDDDGKVAELQWKRIVDDMLKKGKLSNCMSVCDVSGSMSGTPMHVSVALGLLVSELSEEPWKGKLITFSEDPTLHIVEGEDLKSKSKFILHMDWGMNTDFQKVFDLILEVAVNGKLKPEQMIKRVFVFSDMEFDQASANPWETDYQAIVRKYNEKGYGSAVPQIVFWNLRDSRSTPVAGTQKGVGLVSGFSKNLINVFLDNGGDIDPMLVMESAIAGEEYQKLVVED